MSDGCQIIKLGFSIVAFKNILTYLDWSERGGKHQTNSIHGKNGFAFVALAFLQSKKNQV